MATQNRQSRPLRGALALAVSATLHAGLFAGLAFSFVRATREEPKPPPDQRVEVEVVEVERAQPQQRRKPLEAGLLDGAREKSTKVDGLAGLPRDVGEDGKHEQPLPEGFAPPKVAREASQPRPAEKGARALPVAAQSAGAPQAAQPRVAAEGSAAKTASKPKTAAVAAPVEARAAQPKEQPEAVAREEQRAVEEKEKREQKASLDAKTESLAKRDQRQVNAKDAREKLDAQPKQVEQAKRDAKAEAIARKEEQAAPAREDRQRLLEHATQARADEQLQTRASAAKEREERLAKQEPRPELRPADAEELSLEDTESGGRPKPKKRLTVLESARGTWAALPAPPPPAPEAEVMKKPVAAKATRTKPELPKPVKQVAAKRPPRETRKADAAKPLPAVEPKEAQADQKEEREVDAHARTEPAEAVKPQPLPDEQKQAELLAQPQIEPRAQQAAADETRAQPEKPAVEAEPRVEAKAGQAESKDAELQRAQAEQQPGVEVRPVLAAAAQQASPEPAPPAPLELYEALAPGSAVKAPENARAETGSTGAIVLAMREGDLNGAADAARDGEPDALEPPLTPAEALARAQEELIRAEVALEAAEAVKNPAALARARQLFESAQRAADTLQGQRDERRPMAASRHVEALEGTGAGEDGDEASVSGQGSIGRLVQQRVDEVARLIGPDAARRASRGGAALVRFRVDAEGYVKGYELLQSSGSDLLDREIETVLHLGEPYLGMRGPVRVVVEFPLLR